MLFRSSGSLENESKEFKNILSTFKFIGPASNTNLQTLAEVKYTGGLCQNGYVCEDSYVIKNNGQLFYAGRLTGHTINQSDITKLNVEIQSTNFDEIKKHKFTGTCPSAYDGQEVIYTFYTGTEVEVLSSCQYQIDGKIGVFKAVEDIIKGIPWE